MEKLVRLRLDEELDKAAFAEQYKPCEARLTALDEQLPRLEASIDFRRIQALSADTVLTEAKALYDRWSDMPFEQRRAIVETITSQIIIGTEDIYIELTYSPTLSRNSGKEQRTCSRSG